MQVEQISKARRWAEPWVNQLCQGLDGLVRDRDMQALEIGLQLFAEAIDELKLKTFH